MLFGKCFSKHVNLKKLLNFILNSIEFVPMKVPLEKKWNFKPKSTDFYFEYKKLAQAAFFATYLDQMFDFWVKSEYLCISLH